MIAEDPAELPPMRISDADRDRAASVLNEGLAQGRLTADEHAERLDAIYAAKTHAEIVPLISDLPGATAEQAPARMISIFSGTSRHGRWRVPAAIGTVNVFGHTELDLREAMLPGKEVRIRAICVLGDVRITVPPEMHVIDSGWALFGGREFPPDSPQSAHPDAPVLRVSGVSIFGLATVRREARQSRELGHDPGAEVPG